MPQVVGAAAAWVAANVTAVMVFRAVAFVAMMAYSINAQRQLKKDAIAAYNASLRDRNITVRSSVSPRQIIYGKAATGGTLVYAQSSGGLSELLTLVLVLAGHEVDSIESVYLDDNDIYPRGVGGAARLHSRYHNPVTTTLGQVQATVAADGKIQMGLVPASVA